MNSVLICTNNLVPKRLFSEVICSAIYQASEIPDTNVVLVSHYPVTEKFLEVDLSLAKPPDRSKHNKHEDAILKAPFFDFYCKRMNVDCSLLTNLVVGEKAYCLDTIYRQILYGAMICKKNIAIVEHDVLYPKNYLQKVFGVLDSGKDICFWDDAIYLSYQGFFRMPNNNMFNRFSFKNKTLCEHITSQMNAGNPIIEPALKNYSKTTEGAIEYENYSVVNGVDILDVKHGFNTGGYFFVENYMDHHDYWGHKDKYLNMIDQKYIDITQKNLSCFYGFNEE